MSAREKGPIEFVGLRTKMYSLLTYDDNMAKKTAKGIKKRYVEKHPGYDMCLRTLREKTIEQTMYRMFRSHAHKIETVNYSKITLCAYAISDSFWTTALRRWRTVMCGCPPSYELWRTNSGRYAVLCLLTVVVV
jgi:hypothetical protein